MGKRWRQGGVAAPCPVCQAGGGRGEAGANAQHRPPLAGNKQEGARMSHSGSPFEDKSGATPDGEAGPTSFAAGTKLKLINRAITKQTGRRLAFSSDNSNMADAATRGLDMLNRLSISIC